MSSGIDSIYDCTNRATCIKNSGYVWVGRYIMSITSSVKTKLSKSEAIAISNAGLYIVTIYEDGPNEYSYFSYDRGKADGTAAYNAAKANGQPFGTPIFFTVDYDASDSELSGNILQYFKGVEDAISGVSGSTYTIGVYGSGATCDYIYQNVALVYYKYLAMSTGWRGSSGYTGWNIKQSAGGTMCSSMTYDADTTDGGGYGWQVFS